VGAAHVGCNALRRAVIGPIAVLSLAGARLRFPTAAAAKFGAETIPPPTPTTPSVKECPTERSGETDSAFVEVSPKHGREIVYYIYGQAFLACRAIGSNWRGRYLENGSLNFDQIFRDWAWGPKVPPQIFWGKFNGPFPQNLGGYQKLWGLETPKPAAYGGRFLAQTLPPRVARVEF
jgi:hypothetical protein